MIKNVTPIGNRAVFHALMKAVQNDSLCHAYLFYGEEGLGKKTLALYFARAILCEHPTQEGACGSCLSCRMTKEFSHPDLYIAPYEKPLPVATVREIRERSFVKPNQGRFNVFLIPNADRMESASFNALLKVLEEPPGNTVFLLTASDKASTPQTILSRCIPIMLSPLSDEELTAAVGRISQAPIEQQQRAVRHASGNIGKAIGYLENEPYQKAVETADALYRALCKQNEYRFLLLCQTAIADKQMFGKVNEALIGNLRHELLSGGKISGLDAGRLLSLLEFCKQTQGRLSRPFSLQLMGSAYAAGIFSVLRDHKTI